MGNHVSEAMHLHTLPDWNEFCDQCTAELRERDDQAADELQATLEQIGSLELSEDDRARAHRLLTELSTRITLAPLRYRDGDEAAALDSLYKVFLKTRDEMVKSDGAAQGFSNVALLLLERILRPFTGYWHGRLERGLLERQDERRRFRIQLRSLSRQMHLFRAVLGHMAEGSLVSLPPNLAHSGTSADLGRVWPEEYLGPVPTGTGPALDAEMGDITARREAAYGADDGVDPSLGGLGQASEAGEGTSAGLVGLALSGGGIRSATFCLGVIQRLAKNGLLRDVDYLSTVSGGGYLGSFLSTKLHRWAKGDESRKPSQRSYEAALDEILVRPEGRTGDSNSVRWLRNQSKYLLSKDWRERVKTALKVVRGVIPFFPSLHVLYRDRLATCYIEGDPREGETHAPEISKLVGSGAPYHLINTSVNLPGSKNPELRGRRSDFFVFSPRHVGSVLTGYSATSDYEKHLTKDLTSAMAISGAAVSSHMGMRNYGAIARTALTLLNVRLGVWLPNPSQPDAIPSRIFGHVIERWREVWARFDETQAMVNLSDGGHVENLGLYELLRRQCKFIVVVDGECDPDHTSGALIKAARLARIDMGIEIDVDVSDLYRGEDGYSQTHFAFGTIDYAPGAKKDDRKIGYLLYLKLSMTGNEPDYVKDYQRRYPSFPHQTTLDQIFDEDQFEAYRALGEHVAGDLFGEDLVTCEELREKPYRSRVWLQSLVREFI